MYQEGETPIATICSMMQISKPTLHAYIRASARQEAKHRA
ncbi:hypothetical protein ACUNV4_17980 [Granulosicoccus sp. 3-233]